MVAQQNPPNDPSQDEQSHGDIESQDEFEDDQRRRRRLIKLNQEGIEIEKKVLVKLKSKLFPFKPKMILRHTWSGRWELKKLSHATLIPKGKR